MSPYILVVEDDRGNSDLIGLVLRTEGYRVATAAHGAEVLRVIEAGDPDLIVLDLIMPILDGWEFVRRYRARPSSRAAIVVISAAADRQVPGTDAVLAKPFDLDELLGCIERLTAAREGTLRADLIGEMAT